MSPCVSLHGTDHLCSFKCLLFLQEGHTDSGMGFSPDEVKGLNRHLSTTPNFR